MKYWKTLIAAFMAVQLSNAVPVFADEMISTMDVVEEMSRHQAELNIVAQINRQEVQKELVRLGISTDQVKERLASLSDSELKDMAKQMDQAQYGGSIAGILVVVVLVLLIIYLAKRI